MFVSGVTTRNQNQGLPIFSLSVFEGGGGEHEPTFFALSYLHPQFEMKMRFQAEAGPEIPVERAVEINGTF